MKTPANTHAATLLLCAGALLLMNCGSSSDDGDANANPDGSTSSSSSGSSGNTSGDSGKLPDGGDATDGGMTESGGVVVAIGGVDLKMAGNFVLLSKKGISAVPTCTIVGNVGVSPAAASYITGFSLIEAPPNVFATSSQVTGNVFAADYAQPTPSNLTTAIGDMELAFTDAAGRAPTVTELGAGNIGSMTLAPGVYKWSSGLLIPTTVTLAGTAADVWIFQIAQTITMSSAARIELTGGALPKNVFWQVGGAVDIGTTAHFEGILLSQTSIAFQTGASLKGRLLAQAAITMGSSVVIEPSL